MIKNPKSDECILFILKISRILSNDIWAKRSNNGGYELIEGKRMKEETI